MKRLKPSSKNSVKHVPLFSFLFFLSIFFYGCQADLEPTYKEKDIPYIIKQICKEEYNLDVTTKRTTNTLWIYAPLDKILDKNYGIIKDKIFDEEMMAKLRNILITVSRVLINSDNTPEFFALLASDINIGLDYTIIGNILDMKKSYSGSLPWIEANKRYVYKMQLAAEAIGDTTGTHLVAYNIKLPNFLADQIAQRLVSQFNKDDTKNNLTMEQVKSNFEDGSFKFHIDTEKTEKPQEYIDITKEVLKIFTFVIQNYNFDDFETVEIHDLNSGKKINYGRLTLDKL